MSTAADNLGEQARGLTGAVDDWLQERGPASVEVSALGVVDLREETPAERVKIAEFLVDFGYCQLPTNQDWGELPSELLTEPLQRFFAEAEMLDRYFDFKLAPDEAVHTGDGRSSPSKSMVLRDSLCLKTTTLNKIRILAGIDGNLKLLEFPAEGEVSLRSRLLYYRLKLYGLVKPSRRADSPWDALLISKFLNLNTLLVGTQLRSASDILRWINTLGDLEQLASIVAGRYGQTSLVIGRKKAGSWMFAEQREANKSLHKRGGDWSAPEVIPKKIKAEKLTKGGQTFALWNRFGLRFLQLVLWYDGYYDGEIDGVWGGMSHEALVLAGETEGMIVLFQARKTFGPRRRKASQLMPRIGQQFIHEVSEQGRLGGRKRRVGGKKKGKFLYHLVDLAPFITGVLDIARTDEPAPTESVESLTAELNGPLRKAYPDTKPVPADQPWRRGETGWGKLVKHIDSDGLPAPDGSRKRRARRRTYQGGGGLRRALRRIKYWFQEAKAKIKEFVSHLVDTITGPFRRLLGFLKRNIQRAIRTARSAVKRLVHYVTGRPYVTTDREEEGVVVSRFAWDLDTVNLANQNADEELFDRHLTVIREQNEALSTTIEFAMKVVRFVIDVFTGPVGWARAAWRIYKLFQESFSRKTATSPVAQSLALPV